MTQDEYLNSIVKKHRLDENLDSTTEITVVRPLMRIITEWAGECLCGVKLSGSRAKGTAIDISTDLDLFISLSSTTTNSLKEIFNSLYNRMVLKGISARKQNVSIGVTFCDKKIDLVPAKRQSQYGNDHSLYKSKIDSWTKTNIDTHISKVRNSGRITEITALKIWRENHRLTFPSIYLECFAIEMLNGCNHISKAENFMYLLCCIRDKILSTRIVDPANTNNVLSDELTYIEKVALIKAANKSINERYWKNIIW